MSLRSAIGRTFVPGSVCALMLAGCGGVQIKPEPALPPALLSPIQAPVGVVVPDDMRNFVHKETRWGVSWQIDLGDGHQKLVHQLFAEEFANVAEFHSLEEARQAPDLKAIFEPRIEQYSFATARETGGRYYAVTIRYRINLYTPDGTQADSFTLTGYGNALAKGMSSGTPLQIATLGAMRDAAAKFLVQFPDQPAGQKLARNEAIVLEKTASTAPDSAADVIQAVPIDESTDTIEVAATP